MKKETEKKRIAVALGDFDGMHRAHKTVITGAENTVIYCVNNRFSLLQKSIFERRYPQTVFADFNEIKNLSGEEFIESILLGRFKAGMILCGFNFRFGRNAGWSAMDLRNYLEKKDVWVRILEHLDFDGEPISSTRIRKAIAHGEIEKANEMLGYNFTFEAPVITGDRRGRTIGFPTINQHYPASLTDIKYGVYESRAFVGGREYKAFTNIGIRPTVGSSKERSETHILNFSGDLYGENITVMPKVRMRGEMKFSDISELSDRIDADKKTAKTLLEELYSE